MTYLYPSIQQKSYVVELNRCLAVRVGSPRLFKHCIPQSLRLFFTGGILLNVSLQYSTILCFAIVSTTHLARSIAQRRGTLGYIPNG